MNEVVRKINIDNRTIRLTKPDNYSFAECNKFLDRGYDDCLYTLEENRVLKPLKFHGKKTLISVSDDADNLVVEVLLGDLRRDELKKVGRFVSLWFDLERNLKPFYQLLNQDERLSYMVERYHGLRLMGIPDLFEAMCWCVIGQQINLSFAHSVKRQLVEKYGSYLKYEGQRHYLFPKPEILAGLSVEALRELQFSRRKAEYTIGIARQFAEGMLSKSALVEMENTEQMLSTLLDVRGVGPWTANYVLMKSLQRPDCITYGDTGLQSSLSALLGLDRKPTSEEVESFFDPFSGWESYLNIYLWRSLH